MRLFLNPNIPTLLESVAEELDISAELYQEAVLKYEDIGDWLGAAGSPLESTHLTSIRKVPFGSGR